MASKISSDKGLVLYKHDASPPSNAVRMLGAILGLKFSFEDPDIRTGELKSPAFKKINPMSTIPVLRDGDFFLSDSHAISLYLLNKYGGAHKEALYPSELRTRALVDQALFFDTGVAFRQFLNVSQPTFRGQISGPSPANLEEIANVYSVVEAFLESRPYVAADHVTLADLALGASVAALEGILVVDDNKYPRTRAWLKRMEQESYYKEINAPGATLLAQIIKTIWEQNKK